MPAQHPIDRLETHASVWRRLEPLLNQARFPQALLLIGPQHARLSQFSHRLMAMLICQDTEACGHCRACHLLIQGIHPDIHYVEPAKPDKTIKIEVVRDLQQNVYQTPQRSARRFIVIASADKMTVSAANALLKILEEPPSHTIFILMAEQMASLLPTILSRCQKYGFSESESYDYLMLGKFYPEQSSRAELFKQAESIITALCEVLEEKISPCTVAARWIDYGLDDILWFLYLLTAQTIHHQLIDRTHTSSLWTTKLEYLASLTEPVSLFTQLDRINALIRKINHNLTINPTLALEHLLLGYTQILNLGLLYDE